MDENLWKFFSGEKQARIGLSWRCEEMGGGCLIFRPKIAQGVRPKCQWWFLQIFCTRKKIFCTGEKKLESPIKSKKKKNQETKNFLKNIRNPKNPQKNQETRKSPEKIRMPEKKPEAQKHLKIKNQKTQNLKSKNPKLKKKKIQEF